MYNVTDFEGFIRSFIATQLKQNFPNLDVTENSVLDDLHIKPTISTIQPLIQHSNYIDIMMDFANANEIPEADLDSIGVNNYGLVRNAGQKATTMLSISYTKVSNTDNTIIPIGSTFSDSNGITFQTTQEYSFSPAEMQASYNPFTLLYVVNILVVALEVGVAYNLAANQIVNFPSTLSAFIDNVTNPADIINGADKESNMDYAKKLATYYISRYPGTTPGYESDILSLVSGLSDVLVVGKGNPSMTRDLVTVIVGGENKEIHMGGKTDIYLKGSKYEQRNLSLDIHSGKLKLSKPYSTINTIVGFTVTNVSTATVLTAITHYTISNVNDVAYLSLINTDGLAYSKTALDSITVEYETTDAVPITVTDSFTCGYDNALFDVPFASVISVVDSANLDTQFTSPTHYTLVRKDIDGNEIDSTSSYYMSSKESVKIQFVDNSEIENGTNVLVSYTVNSSVADLYTHYEIDGYRITTTDLLIKEASQHAVNIGFDVKLKESYLLDDVKITQIRSAISTYIESLRIGEDIKESDVVSAIYSDNAIMDYLYYIKLPFKSFYTPNNTMDNIVETHESASYISPAATAYIALNKTSITEAVEA